MARESARRQKTDRSAKKESGGSRLDKYRANRERKSLRKRQQQSSRSYDTIVKEDFPTFSPREGNYRLRVLPPTWEGADHYGYDVFVHFGIGPDNSSYICHEKHYGTQDPIDEERRRAEKEGEDQYAKDIAPKKRVAVWVIDRDHEEDGPKLWTMPWTIDRDLADMAEDKRTGDIMWIDDPEEGFDIDLTRSGSGVQTRYTVKIARRSSPIHDDPDKADEWMQFIEENPVPDCLNFQSYDHISNVFGGAEGEEPDEPDRDEDEEDDEPEPPRKPRREEPKDEEEDDDEPPFDIEDEEEEGEDDDEESDDKDEEEGATGSRLNSRLRNRRSR